MTDDVYTPSTAIVREDYIRFQYEEAGTTRDEAAAEFDRWFAAETSRIVRVTLAAIEAVQDVD